MGGGTGGGYSSQSSNLSSNIKDLATKYPLNSEGKFGKPGVGKSTQQVPSKDPLATGKEFFKKLSVGGKTIGCNAPVALRVILFQITPLGYPAGV